MDYLVAQDLIRSEHLDLVREGGLNGFKPFETTCGAATEPLIRQIGRASCRERV